MSVVSGRPFDRVLSDLSASIARPEMNEFREAIASASTAADLERVVTAATGGSDLMEFMRFDLGGILRKRTGAAGRNIVRLVVGNPVLMSEMVSTAPDAGSYAPVTILVDQRADGVHLSYDSMASLISAYGSESALAVATDLDAKIESLLLAAAG